MSTYSGFVIFDKQLGWVLQPRNEGPLATNELGLRDTSFNFKADKKILLLGDSISWGHGIADIKLLYPYLLEEKLGEHTGKSYEIINSGVPGYSTFQQHAYLKFYGLSLKPDYILLQFCLNDVVERYSSMAEYGGDNIFLGVDTRKVIPGLYGWLVQNSRAFESLVRFLINVAKNKEEYNVKNMAVDKLSHELESAWDLTLKEIGHINQLANENEIPLIIMIMPYHFQLYGPDKFNQPQTRMLNYTKAKNIKTIDLLEGLSDFQKLNPNNLLFMDANHLTQTGHEITAALLFESIKNYVY